MPLVLVVIGLLVNLFMVSPSAHAASSDDVTWQVETAFRAALDDYDSGRCWSLYAVGDSESRLAIPEKDFCARIERRTNRLRVGQVEVIQIILLAPDRALIRTRLGVEFRHAEGQDSLAWEFSYQYKDGRWHPRLFEFLSLANLYQR